MRNKQTDDREQTQFCANGIDQKRAEKRKEGRKSWSGYLGLVV